MVVKTAQTSRGEQAKQQLLEAAIEIFGRSGLEGATTRNIAQQANQNIAAIAYYFGSKEGLYLAVVQHIADRLKAEFTPLVEAVDHFFAKTPKPYPPEQILAFIHQGMVSYNRLIFEKSSINISRIMSHEQLTPTEAYSVMHEQGLAPIYSRLNKLIAHYIGADEGQISTQIHTHALLGEILSFRLAREALLRQTGWDNIGAKEYELINQVLSQHINLLLDGLRNK
ncbi:transcriptional regulator CecR [Xenorhabdus nematophila]|uniref:Transcriptional repressor with homeodomain-like DNA binding domain (TetR/AcrR family) n=1 Tax=Xenorhabdus nematophila (strain ATCC 19061 / DSM 3370 / CCUG 14189 / LMG 1036 / NCIMB 9965 / AN6) TaxID=406817 RepID=D3VB83_XENNA|nr:transcriptional regulator CecR [Xenorhabdus nematophila]CEE92257.1 putative transcriptional repressor with homeodomain-like DNA binding domain (TetR/AcrR family) [Xenorhabdus nematophila str. Anatoliense]CEF33431.1 putative transcriptional repressor with homeodomain-like DNA binding domain (TetR/AcrR family) [Xenorhabdus nematophila str. Websteri]AYA39731.1 transcriptional regulator [Xenorhabdus nematophila]KHD27849.1 transcriptional regulator [Xenorhabdus nematophila]MBA0018302.1 transcrip